MRGKAKCSKIQNISSLVYLKRKTLVHTTLTCYDLGENDELANS